LGVTIPCPKELRGAAPRARKAAKRLRAASPRLPAKSGAPRADPRRSGHCACYPRSRRRAGVQQQLHPSSKERKVELLTHQQREQMIANGRANQGRDEPHDLYPVVRLYSPWTEEIWLLTEIDPNHPEIAYGLYDAGQELFLGPVNLADIAKARGPQGERIRRDDGFVSTRRLSTYAYFARVVPRTATCGGEDAQRHLSGHHQPDRRRAREGRAPVAAAVGGRPYAGARCASAPPSRHCLSRRERHHALDARRRQRLPRADLDDLQTGDRSRRRCPQGRERRPHRSRPYNLAPGNRLRDRRVQRKRHPNLEKLHRFQCRADRRLARALLRRTRTAT